MIHLIGERSSNILKVFTRDRSLWQAFRAGFDAWGNHDGQGDPSWGFNCWMPIGHYMLGPIDEFDTPIASEGFGQISVLDLDAGTLGKLVSAGLATSSGLSATIGGIDAPLAQLAAYGRSAIMVHGGGSDSPNPLADNQGLYRTEGCTRMLNADWRTLAAWLQPLYAGNAIIYTALETPADLGQ